MSDMILETYNKGGQSHQGVDNMPCWLCSGEDMQQSNNLLREKEMMAKSKQYPYIVHLRFVMNGKNYFDRIHTFLEKDEEFQSSLISTIYCFSSSA